MTTLDNTVFSPLIIKIIKTYFNLFVNLEMNKYPLLTLLILLPSLSYIYYHYTVQSHLKEEYKRFMLTHKNITVPDYSH
jgi:hypothetical protein